MADNLLTEKLPLAVIEFIGPDSEKFLQGQLTCDVTEITIECAAPGALCAPNGRIKASFILALKAPEHYYMVVPSAQAEFLVSALQPYIAFFKSEMTISNELMAYGLGQSQTRDSNAFACHQDSTQLAIELPVNRAPAVLAEQTDIKSRQLIISTVLPEQATTAQLSSLDWQALDALSGIIWITGEQTEQFLPHDLSLPRLGGVSFTKGCYTGQEIVARMHYRGKPKYQFANLLTEATELNFSAKLSLKDANGQTQKAGQVIEQLNLNDNRKLILAVVKKELLETQQITLLSDETPVLSEIIVPPMLVETTN